MGSRRITFSLQPESAFELHVAGELFFRNRNRVIERSLLEDDGLALATGAAGLREDHRPAQTEQDRADTYSFTHHVFSWKASCTPAFHEPGVENPVAGAPPPRPCCWSSPGAAVGHIVQAQIHFQPVLRLTIVLPENLKAL
jgi:hypothetical protein